MSEQAKKGRGRPTVPVPLVKKSFALTPTQADAVKLRGAKWLRGLIDEGIKKETRSK